MYSSAQIVFLFDVNCLDLSSYSVDDVNVHIAAFKLCCLRLITELGAQTQNASDIRWASKFYDSLIFKPGKTNNLFFDFNRRSYDVFDTEISEKLKVSLSNSHNGGSANSTAQRKTRQNNSLNHTPCFILNKAIQEALKDYNWDLPDISSPVNTRKTRNNLQDKTNGHFNAIVVFTKFPQDVQAAKEFTGNYTSNNPDALAKLFFEKATLQALEEATYFRLFCIETSPNPLKLNELPVLESLNSLLGQFNGSLLSISSIVDCSGLILKSPREQVLQSQKLHLHGLGRSWFIKGRHCRSGRLRKPQPGPTLVWQSDGVQTEKILLEILVLQGRVSHEWQEMSVVGSARASSASHAAMASLNSQVMLCRQLQSSDTPASAVSFDAVLRGLSQFRLVLVLQLTCGGLGLLSPFLGGVGCLTVLSSSGLAQPPLSQHQMEDSLVALATKPLLSFTQAAIKKALNAGGGIGDRKVTAAAPAQPSDCSLPPSFKQFMLEPWYCGAALPPTGALLTRRNVLSQTQLSILHRAQRKCCPQLSHLAGAADSSTAVLCPTKSMLGISPDQATSGAAVLVPKLSSSQSRLGAGVHDGSFSKPAKTVSRALQLVNKSKIVTAQQKVKEQKNEEEELEVARERRAQQSSLRSQKSQAIMSSTLSNIQDTTNAATVIQSLIDLRDSVSGRSSTEGEPQDGGDVFGIAQTIINVAVMHVRSANETTATASTSTASDAHAADTAKSGVSGRQALPRFAVPLGQHCQADFNAAFNNDSTMRENEEPCKDSSDVAESCIDRVKKSDKNESDDVHSGSMRSLVTNKQSANEFKNGVETSCKNGEQSELVKHLTPSKGIHCGNKSSTSTSSNLAANGSLNSVAKSESKVRVSREPSTKIDESCNSRVEIKVTSPKTIHFSVGRETRRNKNILTLMMSSFKVSRACGATVSGQEKTIVADNDGLKRDDSKTRSQSSEPKTPTPVKTKATNTHEDLTRSLTRCLAFVCSNETKVKHSLHVMELREVLSEVMLSSRDISSLPKDRQLQQFQLHVLLHLETMWLMGYSSGSEGTSDAVSPEQERRSAEREAHLEEILRLLRGITLHFNPSFTTSFLNQTVLANYEDTLPDVLTEVFEELNQPLPPSLAGPLSVNTTLDTPPLQQLASVQSSVHSAGSMMGSGGAGGTRGGVRRRNSNMAVVGGGAGRQVVVPGSRMARLTRATSEQQAQGLEKSTRGKSSVRRSLFDNRSAANSGSKLSQGAPVTPQRQKRCRTSDKSGDDSPDRTAKRMKVARTPREERKRRRSLLKGDEDALQPLPNELYTPSKRDSLASPLTPASRRLLSASKGGVLAPGTPAHLLGRSIASLRRCTGSAVVAESPELKGKSQLSGRRCATGRSSFYSGAQSRNCERARTSLLAQRLQSNCLDKVLGNSSSSGSVQASQTNSNNVSASNFLFSKIIASAPQAEATSRIAVKGDRRRSLRRVLDFDNVGVQSKSLIETSSPSRRLTRSSTNEHFSPVKTTISKTFPLGTPKKESSSISLHNETHNSAERKSPCTPKRLMSENDRLLALGSPSNVTPSKRVQFSLEYTPSKVQSATCANNTPKSILKTPTRTPLRQATSKTPRSCITPSRRPSLQVFRTPRSSAALSPDLFSCGKSGASLFSPAKTPSKSPMKLSSLTPTKQQRSPLVLFDKSRSFFSPSKRFSRSPKEVLDRSDSPAKTRISPGRNDSKGGSVSAKAQHAVALDHGLDVCDDVSQSDDKALYASSKVEKVPEINLQNEGTQNCLPDASTINGIFSSDSAIVIDTGNDTAALKYSDERVPQDLNSSQCRGNTNVLHEAPAADFIQNSNQEDALDKFLEIFDDLIDQGVTGNEIPSQSLDTFVDPVTNNKTNIISLDMSALNTQSSEVQILASKTHASDGVSMINESCCASDEKSFSDEYICEPLLDIAAMLTAEQETIKTNAVWLDTEALDNTFSSPEIEINHADRDSVEKCILKRKGNQIDPEPSFRSNDGPALEGTTATQDIEPDPSCFEENPLENSVPSNSVEKILCSSSAAKPGTSIASSELELGNMAYSNSLLPFKDSSNGGEKDIELLRDLVNFQVSNNKESSNQPNCTLLQECQEESDNNKMTKFPTSETLESNGDKSVDIPDNAKMTSKQLSSSTIPSQKSRCKTEESKTEILHRETSSVDFSEVMKEMPPSPTIKSKSKKRKFSGRRLSSDAGCSFTVTAVGSQTGKEKEESERELHWKIEGRRPSRLRRPTSVRQDCKSRYLPTRKSSNAVSSYLESDDDFADEDDSELFTTSAGYKIKSKKSFENFEARKDKSEENERKRNCSKNSDEKEKLSEEKVKPEKENVYVEPTERGERRSRCNKRLINWSDSEEDIEEISNVDKKDKISGTNSRAKKSRYPRRGTDDIYNSISSPSSGSVFSPGSLQCDQSLGVTPLQNVENFTQARRSIRNRLPTSYVDFPSDDSELFTERSLNNSQLDDTPVSTSSQVKIDKYLSPVRRPSSDFKPPVVKERNSTSTPNTEIDWKQTKPARTREKLLDRGVPKPNEEFQEPLASVKPAKSKKKKAKKKSVKLKFKKSGDEYQVSRPDLSGSSLNTTASECHSVSQASCSESEEKKKKKEVKGKRDNSNNDSLLTPLRFTRHMSKDLSITPELFQKLVSASPNSKASKPCASPFKSPKRPLPNIKKFPQVPALTNVASLAKQEDNVWRVQSIQGSPTMKAFIRVSNSPSCSKSHLHLSSPSVSSMLHLSTSPLLSKQRSIQDPGNQKLKAHNNDDLHASSRHDRAQHSQFNGKDKNTIVRKLYNHDVLKSKKRSLNSSEEDGPSLKRLRDRSPVKRIQRRASKKLYD